MSNDITSISTLFLKDLDEKIKKLAPLVDQLDVLAFNFKKLSTTVDHIDTLVFHLRQGYNDLNALREKIEKKE